MDFLAAPISEVAPAPDVLLDLIRRDDAKPEPFEIDIGEPEYTDDLSDLADFNLPARVLEIVEHGRAEGERKPSRSEWIFDACCNLLRFGVSPEQVLGLLLDDRWGISESINEKPDADRHARRQVRQALAAVRSEAKRDFDDGPIDPE